MSTLSHYLTTHHNFPSADRQQIEAAFLPKTYAKGGFLLQAGQTDRYIRFVEQGVLRVYEEMNDGTEQTFYFMSPGQFAADIESFNSRQPATGTIQAVTICQTREISYDGFQRLLHDVPDWNSTVQRITQKALLEKVQKRSRLVYEDARSRYQRLLTEQPDVARQVSLGIIASYLGITLPSLSRLRKQLAVEHA